MVRILAALNTWLLERWEGHRGIKMRLAYLLERHTDLCWAGLVLWAQGYTRWSDIPRRQHDPQKCDYCGKCGIREPRP